MKRKIRSGDQVVVIAGNDRGKTGKVLSFKKKDRVLIEGINIKKKHMKPTQQNQKGQIIDIECPIHCSNVKPYVGDKGIKLRVRVNDEGERELYYQDGKKKVVYRPVRKPKS